MLRPWLSLPCALVLVTGCDATSGYLDWPPGAGSFALVFNEGSETELVLVDQDQDPVLEIETEQVFVVVFGEQSLESIGLPVGPVELEASGPLTRTLPLEEEGTRVFEGRAGEDWTALAEPPPFLDDLHFRDPRIRSCPSLQQENFFIPDVDRALFGVVVGPDEGLIGFDRGDLFRVFLDGRFESVQIDGLDGAPSALTTRADELWIGTSSGSVYRSSIDPPWSFERVASSSTAIIDRLAVTRVGDHDELVVLDRTRTLWRHDGSRWHDIYTFLDDGSSDRSTSLIGLKPGEVLSVALSESVIVRLRDGLVHFEDPISPPITGFNLAFHSSSAETLLASTLGKLHSDQTGEWLPYYELEESVNVGAMEELDGFLAAGNIKGGLELVDPSDPPRSCQPLTLIPLLRPDVMLRFGQRLLIAGNTAAEFDGSPMIVVSVE